MTFSAPGLFAPAQQLAGVVPAAMGLHHARTLIIVRRSPSSVDYIEVEPVPHIETVSPRMIQKYKGVPGVEIEVNDLHVKGILKHHQNADGYTKEQLIGAGISYLIDAQMIEGILSGGISADKVPGIDLIERDLTWEIILRQRA